MPVIYAKAPAKLILLGEHAVVYGHPAIAVPIQSLWLKATCQAIIGGTPRLVVSAPQLGIDCHFNELPEEHPLRSAIRFTMEYLQISTFPSVHLTVRANFPFSSGLGSSAALAVAVIRSLSDFLGHPLDLPTVNALAFMTEVHAHGTPSGVDNSVISYNQPIWFVKGQTPLVISPGADFHFVIADTGIKKSTAITVNELAIKREQDQHEIDRHYEAIGKIAIEGRMAFEKGKVAVFGQLMNLNQAHLAALGVSCAELDHLIDVSLLNGALGAKLTGGGRGGFMLALVASDGLQAFSQTLLDAGAKQLVSVPILQSTSR